MSDCCNKALTAQEKWIKFNEYPSKGRERTWKINDRIRCQPIKMELIRR